MRPVGLGANLVRTFPISIASLAHLTAYIIYDGYRIYKLFVKNNRKAAGLTQEEFAMRSGLGLRFVRELEQGKETVRMDKVNIALAMFDMEAVPGRKDER